MKNKKALRSYRAVLTGNPNVGKSTVFNALTGLKQHTGNWPGKTVVTAEGNFRYGNSEFVLTDVPGTYSLCAGSPDEEAARDAVLSQGYDCVVIVADASSPERQLPLILQVLEASDKAVVCLNLVDEARKKHISTDVKKLSELLGVPVIPTAARSGEGLDELKRTIEGVADGSIVTDPVRTKYNESVEKAAALIEASLDDVPSKRALSLMLLCKNERPQLQSLFCMTDELSRAFLCADTELGECDVQQQLSAALAERSESICRECVIGGGHSERDRRLDRIMTSRRTGIPILLLLLTVVFYMTIIGANYPSELLSAGFEYLKTGCRSLFSMLGAGAFVTGLVVDGMLGTLGSVVSVMLPPMAIFFPLFALLEASGYLPRAAFILDSSFQKAGVSGKQALTMMMGFGCNACGITGCRIIENESQRKIAALTNNFSPCNGRFPTLIALISAFLAGSLSAALRSAAGALILAGVIVLSVAVSLAVSKLLSLTMLRGDSTSFVMELPPYRRPRIINTIVHSLTDKALSVLLRAVAVAVPAGAVIWLLANISVNGQTIADMMTGALDPFARFIGLDGVILTAFILGFPANETVLPIALMLYASKGTMTGYDSLEQLYTILTQNGWTAVTAICAMIFTVMHFPCSTACITFYKETRSLRWTVLAVLLPTLCGVICCAIVSHIFA